MADKENKGKENYRQKPERLSAWSSNKVHRTERGREENTFHTTVAEEASVSNLNPVKNPYPTHSDALVCQHLLFKHFPAGASSW